ncbi:putative Carrier domain-containing protein [Seiridium cardinale]|uniref:Carrier domain-containing protein n=1 Tax=Seiridium cardinale TaxID=138064 RepID=A0ABR2XTR9_9PEZI
MGSLDPTVSLQLDALADKCTPDFPIDRVVETIWAITRYVYTRDSEVRFVRYYVMNPQETSDLIGRQLRPPSTRYYRVCEDTSVVGVLETGSDILGEESRGRDQEVESSAPPMLQIVRKMALWAAQGASAPDLRSEVGKTELKRQDYEYLVLICDTFKRITQSIIEDWTTPIRQLHFLGDANRSCIVNTASAPAEVSDSTLCDILTQQSRQRPSKTALEAWDGHLTYAELLNLSQCMAKFLLQQGIMPGERVGISMKKSKWYPVAFWGTLMAGCTVVPLDIRNPRNRTESLLARVKARYVIMDESTSPVLSDADIGVLFCHADILESIAACNPHALPSMPGPSSEAVILFTSGSTGLPKGVIIEHGPMYTGMAEIAASLALQETSRIFQFSPFVFDVSILDICATMLMGGCVCMPSEEDRLDNLPAALRETRVTHATLTSTVMSRIVPEDVPDLRHMVAIGEPLSKENFIRWNPHVHITTAYGLVETVVMDSFGRSEDLASDFRNIGKGEGTCLWIIDQDNPDSLLPVGAVGEILIEGSLLARGYMNDPERTAERFIQAPPWLEEFRGKNNRCCRSGDLGVRNADGTVLYLGRKDTQVKIGGQRVELGEIESNIIATESFLTTVAVEKGELVNRGGVETLVAFFVGSHPSDDVPANLLSMNTSLRKMAQNAQSKLFESLPRYMVPSLFIPIRDIPRNANGKRDRNVLRSWVSELTEEQISAYQLRDSSTYRPPQTPEETLLQQLWANVLRAPEAVIGSHDEFFKCGGDSIRAIELAAAVRQHGRSLTVTRIFEHPVLRDMALFLGNIENTEIMVQPLSLLGDAVSTVASIHDAARICQVPEELIEDLYPATPMQEALMSISAHRSNVYTHRLVFKIPESLDIPRFQRSWEMLVAAQPILRTRIVTLPQAGTIQVVLRSDISWNPSSALDQFIHYDEITPFAYGSALTRYAIVRDDQNVMYFAWSGHHATSDGWSRPAMFEELGEIYVRGYAHKSTPFTPFIQYLSNLDLQTADDFWKEQFPDIVEPFPRLPSASYSPEARSVRTLGIEFDRPAAPHVTTATLIQGAWALVTAAYGNDVEAVFGVTLSGRDAPAYGVTQTLGITITTVPVRIILDQTNTLLGYLQETQRYMSRVKEYQHVGLQRIRRLSPEAQSATRFQNLLVVQPANEEKDHEGLVKIGLELVKREEKDTRDFALTVQCVIGEDGNSMHIKAHYDDQVVTEQEIDSMLHLFQHVVKQLATESTDRSLYDLDKMSPHDLNLIKTWNFKMPSAVEETLHGLIQAQATKTPDALALDGPAGTMTYAELDFLSSQLAYYLQQNGGVSIESRVTLCFAKSEIPIIAMLATLKSGGTCASTNPEHPTARLLEQNKDLQSTVVLCDEANVSRFVGNVSRVISVTSLLLDNLKTTPTVAPRVPIFPNNAAFVVYTSGSTGKPKGSVLEHRSLATEFLALGRRVGMGPHSRSLQFSSYTFDAHILEIIGTLIHGGCICVISDYERMNSLSQTMNERKVNFALLTKTVSRLLEPEQVPTLKTLILSGEPNGHSEYRRWAGQVRLFNGLGPSECTPLVCVTQSPVGAEDDPANIGHALACHLWITDHRRPDRLVPVGCLGELTVEGPIVGRGYVNRPKQNAASFIHDPAWSQDGSGRKRRFYRTGDLARMNTEGSITFIGRADNQVKIHGQRVELGEVEDCLRQCSSAFVASLVDVLEISSRGGAASLTVFCRLSDSERNKAVRSDSQEGSIVALNEETRSIFKEAQAKLADLLPRHMVPSLFIPVTDLPLNSSGKLDRKTLLRWAAMLSTDNMAQYYLTDLTQSREPETEPERVLQSLWAKVLSLSPRMIHAEDNFFRLGGDSVTSMRLIAEARAEGISMTVADVFRVPMLKDMALAMRESHHEVDSNDVNTYTPMSLIKDKVALDECIREAAEDCGVSAALVEDIYPCNPSQEALMAVSSHRPRAYTYQLILKLPDTMDLDRYKSAWDTLVAAHAIFRTRIIFRPGLGSLQVALRSGIEWASVTDMSLSEYLERRGALFVQYGSELCKFAIVHHGGETIFVATLHHALYDGWSLMRTYEEFTHIYKTGTIQTSVVPYPRFCGHLHCINQEEIDTFWRRQFPNVVKSYPELPSHHYVPRPQSFKSSSIPLNRKVGSEVTLATIVQTAWGILMTKYSDNDEVIFGLLLSGRDTPVDGITDIIGPTIATVPMRMVFDRSSTLGGTLETVQRQTAETKKYQHTGMQRIRRLSPQASAAVDFHSLLVIHTMGDTEITSPLKNLGLQVMSSNAEEFMDLALTADCTIKAGELHVTINYDDHIIAHEQAEFMLNQLGHISSLLLGEHDQERLSDLDLVSPYDIQQLNVWNSEIPDFEPHTLHNLVETQARKTPDTIAISSFDGEYTYKELDVAADKLAGFLVSIGVGPEKSVALSFRKSRLAVVAILAVLKSGGVCVSLNWEHPLSRRVDICREIEAVAVLCDADQEEEYAGVLSNTLTVTSASISAKFSQPTCDWVRPAALPNSAAFIVYTSGSTGKPKGCVLEHHSICLAQKVHARTTNVTATTRTLQFAAYSFDAHVLEIFGTLIHGGVVCIVSDDERMNGLVGAINSRKATRLHQTPTVAQMIEPSLVPTVDLILLGAEPLTYKVVDMWTTAPGVQAVQAYAPSETSNIATANFNLGKDKDPANIGHPCGCAVWITEQDNPDRLMPVGSVGEILIEGHAVGRGYLKRPDATAAAFIENPAWSRASNHRGRSRRFYRTGDMAYFNPDGSIHYVGRTDTQVKIHGQRVELREIEYLIHQRLPAGSEAVVEIVDFKSLAVLTAFIKLPDFVKCKEDDLIVSDKEQLSAFGTVVQQLERYLPERLPQYMVPSAFVPISHMPTSASTKIERKRLRLLAKTLDQDIFLRKTTDIVKQMPVNDIEAALQRVWSVILGHETAQIGTNEPFMSLGGDSITAMQAVSECRRLGIQLLVSTILQKKTIQAIAIRCTVKTSFKPSTAPRAASQDNLPVDLAPIQKLYFEQESQDWTRFNQSFLCRVKQGASAGQIRHALEIVVARHTMLRTRFVRFGDDKKWMQYVVPMTSESYRFAQYMLDPKEAGKCGYVADYIDDKVRNSLRAMDISSGPIFCADLFALGSEDSILYLVAHHLVVDLVSWRIILNDLEQVLREGGLPSDLNPTFTFQDWVSLLERTFAKPEVSLSSVYPLPQPISNWDYWGVDRTENTLGNSIRQSFSLDADLTSLIIGQSNSAMRTKPLDIILGILMHSFRDTFKDRDVAPIFIEHHGREIPNDDSEDIDLSQTVGWFTTVYPVQIPISSSSTAIESIRLAKDTKSLVPKNGLPYFGFRHLSQEGEKLAHHTPAEILINFSGSFQQFEASDRLIQLETRIAAPNDESDPESHRFALIDLEVGVGQGVMKFSYTVHKHMLHMDKVQAWMAHFRASLKETLQQLAAQPPSYTLSDFPSLDHTYEALQDLLSQKLPQFGLAAEEAGVEDIYPCTSMQEGILLSQQTESEAYVLQHVWEFEEDLVPYDNFPVRLRQAWDSIVQRHTTLRTGIIEHAASGRHFVQVVLKNLPPSSFVISEAAISSASEISHRVELEEDSFWKHVPKLTLYSLNNGNRACSLKLSHVLMDGMSLDIFMQELTTSLTGENITSIPMDFRTYVHYELSKKDDSGIDYWLTYLQNLEPCHIPSDTRHKSPDISESYDYMQLPEHICDGLALVCKRLGITQAVFLQTAWAIVLGAFTGQDDVCFGYIASQRDTPLDGIDQAIGLLISMQVSRARIGGTVSDMLQNMNRDVISGLEHRNVSLALIRSSMGSSDIPLFNTCMTIRRRLGDTTSLEAKLPVKTVDGPERTEFAIALDASVGSTGAQIGMSFQITKISRDCARSIVGSLETVICSLMRDQNQPVADVELIGEYDRLNMETWNSPAPKMEPATLHGLVEQQARHTPDATATTGFDGEYSYAQLVAMADKLASHLITYGVAPEVRVVLCFAKSTWPIISMLATLKAGGVCCSVNPQHPDRRLLDICDDVGTTVVLCDRDSADRFQGHVAHVVTVDDDLFSGLQGTSDWIQPIVQPTNAAFVVYTSGSTGRPKGCVLEHHSVLKSQLVNGEAMQITPSSRVLQFATYTFDVSICEIFAPLVKGACVCVISDAERDSDLAAAINARQADWFMLTPSVAQLVSPSDVPTLKTLVFGGEALSRDAIDIWSPHVHIANMWGPTECGNSACINPDVTGTTDPLNIGRPSMHRIWVTEQNNPHRLVPVGCVGELVAEGPMLGRGYINRPEATAAAFVTNLAWSRDGTHLTRRFYRTGDLGRFNRDGTVTFVGRADSQVKINGQRVELGEIQHQIAQLLPNGYEVIVELTHFGARLNRVLTAFIKRDEAVPNNLDPSELGVKDSQQLQRFKNLIKDVEQSLCAVLPQYMLPIAYIPVYYIPKTPSAKADRRRLRDFAEHLTADSAFVRGSDSNKRGPCNEMERDLQVVFAELLNQSLSYVSMDDTFMALGGDSITAMRAAAACRKLGISLPVSLILRQKTIARIAPHCVRLQEQTRSAHVRSPPPKMGPGLGLLSKEHLAQMGFQSTSEIASVSLVSAFQTLYLQGHLAIPQRHWMYFYIDLPSDIDVDRLRSACFNIVQRHSLMRSVFVKSPQGFLQVTLKTLHPEMEFHVSQDDMTTVMEQLFLGHLAEPAVLGKPFVYFKILRATAQVRLLIRVSHAQFDGLSWAPFMEDFTALYDGQSLPRPIEYTSFLVHAEERRAEAAAYWRSLLEGAEPTPIIQVNAPPPFADKGVIRIEKTVPHFKVVEDVTPATTFNAAVALLLQSRTGISDVTFGRLTSGRAGLSAEFQNVIGPCVNLTPVRVHIRPGSRGSDVLQSIHQQYIDTLPHETMALDDIIRDCTNWQTSFSEFPIITQYLSHEEGSEAALSDGRRLRINVWDPVSVDPFPWSLCLGAFPGPGGVKISVAANSKYIRRATVEIIVDELIATINRITRC